MLRRFLLCVAAVALASCETVPEVAGARDRTPADIGAFFDCVRENSLTIIAAHRGGDAPFENAIPTFERTVGGAPGPVALEIDVRRTKDGVLVLMHDETLDRTTTGTGPVSSVTASQFAALRLKDGAGGATDTHPPTLRRALDWSAGRAMLELDVKRGAPFEQVIAEVRAAGAANRVIIITYNAEDTIKVHRLAPDLMISAPAEAVPVLEALSSVKVDLSRILAWTGTRESNSALNIELSQKGVEVLFGTLGDTPQSWDNRFAREGDVGYTALADTGIHLIASDRPLEAMRAIDDADGPGVPANACLTARRTQGASR